MNTIKSTSTLIFVFTFAIHLWTSVASASAETTLPSLTADQLQEQFSSFGRQIDTQVIQELPLQANGRIKPLDTFAREANLFITGKRSMWELDPTQFYLSLILFPESQNLEIIDVRDTHLRTQMGLDMSKKRFSVATLEKTGLEQRASPLLEKEKQNKRTLTEEEKNILEVFNQLQFARYIFSGEHFLGAVDYSMLDGSHGSTPMAADGAPVLKIAKDYLTAVASRNPQASTLAEQLMASTRAQAVPDLFKPYMGKMPLEVFYNKAHLFLIAAFLYLLLGIVLVVPTFSNRIPKGLLVGIMALPVVLHISGFALRVYITGFAPVTNMYGTMLWVSFGVTLFSLMLLALYHNRSMVGYLLIGASFVLLISESFPLVLSPDMDPIVAVLRSNLWLTIHVLTITISYAAFTICMLLGNFALIKTLIAPQSQDFYKTYAHFTYRMIQLGVFLITVGIILGGVWADYSWGRFWGWDPKETWALIADLGFLAILHARFVGWIRPFGILAAAPIAYLLVIMAWYGVNFILAAGLHSYGFSSGGAAMVATFVSVQVLLSVVSFVVQRTRSQKLKNA